MTRANDELNRAMENHPDYDSLPESIKLLYTRREFAWLGDGRHRVVENECMPDSDVIE